MNRRNFIGTLAALAGVVLAKIKAPAKDYLAVKHTGDFRPGVTQIAATEPIQGFVHGNPGQFFIFTETEMYEYRHSDGYGWRPYSIDKPAE